MPDDMNVYKMQKIDITVKATSPASSLSQNVPALTTKLTTKRHH